MAAKELIATVTVGTGGAATIDFTSIPQTYSDLLVVYSTRPGTTDNSWVQGIWLNGVSTSRSSRVLEGSGAAVASYGQPTVITVLNDSTTATANTFSNGSIYIPNYTSNSYKNILSDSVSETNAATSYQWIVAGLWSNTAAVTQVTLVAPTTYAQYSTASLYGFKKGSDGTTTVA